MLICHIFVTFLQLVISGCSFATLFSNFIHQIRIDMESALIHKYYFATFLQFLGDFFWVLFFHFFATNWWFLGAFCHSFATFYADKFFGSKGCRARNVWYWRSNPALKKYRNPRISNEQIEQLIPHISSKEKSINDFMVLPRALGAINNPKGSSKSFLTISPGYTGKI